VFVSKRDGNHEIYVMNADGSEQRRLSQNKVSDYTPAWSPDGKQIAFISDRVNHPGSGNIYSSNLMGDRTQLTHSFLEHNSPVWSSDGQKIAYTISNENGGNEIRVMNLDGSEGKTLLRSSTFSYSNLAWQPLFSLQK
jgi:Tol biopolymer transport system component